MLTYCEAFVLSLEAFMRICHEFPQFKQFMQRLVVSRCVKNSKVLSESGKAEQGGLGRAGQAPRLTRQYTSQISAHMLRRGGNVISAASRSASRSTGSQSRTRVVAPARDESQ